MPRCRISAGHDGSDRAARRASVQMAGLQPPGSSSSSTGAHGPHRNRSRPAGEATAGTRCLSLKGRNGAFGTLRGAAAHGRGLHPLPRRPQSRAMGHAGLAAAFPRAGIPGGGRTAGDSHRSRHRRCSRRAAPSQASWKRRLPRSSRPCDAALPSDRDRWRTRRLPCTATRSPYTSTTRWSHYREHHGATS